MPQSKRHPARRPQPRPARSRHAPARSRTGGKPTPPPATGARATLERRSVGPLVLMHSLPGWLVPVLIGVFLLVGLMIPSGWAGLLLLVPAAFLAWLLALSWPLLRPGGRALRALVVLLLVGAAVARVLGKF